MPAGVEPSITSLQDRRNSLARGQVNHDHARGLWPAAVSSAPPSTVPSTERLRRVRCRAPPVLSGCPRHDALRISRVRARILRGRGVAPVLRPENRPGPATCVNRIPVAVGRWIAVVVGLLLFHALPGQQIDDRPAIAPLRCGGPTPPRSERRGIFDSESIRANAYSLDIMPAPAAAHRDRGVDPRRSPRRRRSARSVRRAPNTPATPPILSASARPRPRRSMAQAPPPDHSLNICGANAVNAC